MKNSYISQFGESNQAAGTAIIMLPDIFISTDYAIATAKEFAKVFHQPVFMLDYFYQLTGQKNAFSPSESARAFELLKQMRGEDFVEVFKGGLNAIQAEYPSIETLSVIGFCFGGRLAYLAGLEPMVEHVVSFYGAGANTPDYYEGKSPVEALVEARGSDKDLKILSFYGTEDSTIPENDRAMTKQALEQAKIPYSAKEYPVGHAYFQAGRENYDKASAESSWQDLKEFMNG